MKLSIKQALLALFFCSVGHSRVNTKCVHPDLGDIFRNECAEFIITAGTDTYGVRLPITASQGQAFIGTMYDDKVRRAVLPAISPPAILDKRNLAQVARTRSTVTTIVSVVASPLAVVHQNQSTGTNGTTDTTSDSDSDWYSDSDSDSAEESDVEPEHVLVYPANSTDASQGVITNQTVLPHQSVAVPQELWSVPQDTITQAPQASSSNTGTSVSTSSISSTKAPMIIIPFQDNIGPGINDVPIKAIKGQGAHGKSVTYPNKHGSPLCKKVKPCITVGKIGPVKPCLDDLQEKIHLMEIHDSNLTFSPLQPIACSPSVNSKYCAYIERVPFLPKDGKNERLFRKMNIEPYRDMQPPQVPIGAIREGIDWVKQGKAKLCGAALLPVPDPKHEAYILKVDVDMGLPDMDPEIRALHEALEGAQ